MKYLEGGRTCFVLTNSEEKVVAIITANSNEDFSAKVKEAIKDDVSAKSVELNAPDVIEDIWNPIEITALIVDEDDDCEEETFTLDLTAEY